MMMMLLLCIMRVICLIIIIQMRGENGELSVDQIIQRVLIRGNHNPYTYSKKSEQLLTSQDHLWHYRLQQQNVELKQKVKNLSVQLKKKVEQRGRCSALMKQIQALRVELEDVGRSNRRLQEEINQMRLKNSSINDSIQHSLDDSIRNRKHNRSCSCIDAHHPPKNAHPTHKRDQMRINDSSSSPEKEILKTKKEVSVMCLMLWRDDGHAQKVADKQEHLKALRKIVENQQKLLAAYAKEIEEKKAKTVLSKNKTMESTDRIPYPIERTVSHNTFKPMSSAGSIVKIRRG